VDQYERLTPFFVLRFQLDGPSEVMERFVDPADAAKVMPE